jgi:class 3 adenylate cyclase/tetratricopeptide (TPR) repeat protein
MKGPLRCPACAHENRERARFCDDCGAPLAAAPAGAGRGPGERVPRDYTPRHLAERILTTRSSIEGERKLVTVLFADVQRSLELAAAVDAEVWHGILDRFFQILASGIHRHEGTINQYTGDGIMALFGAPIAHEDHAQRACHAALALAAELRGFARELRREHGLDFSVRMGLNSGEVVVGKIGDDLRMDYTAQGQTVGLAARLQQIAEGGRIYLSRATGELVEGYFRLEDLGEFHLKGLPAPERVCELLGRGPLRTRLDAARARGLSRFVGRERELLELEAALARAARGRGELVAVVADAGMGKSRLCLEFLERCRARGLRPLEARGVSHGQSLPLLPFAELARAACGVRAGDDRREARQKIAGTLVLLDGGLGSSLPRLLEFLAVAEDSGALRTPDAEGGEGELLPVLERLLFAAAGPEPTLILLEDLHWFDPSSEALLARLAEALAATRTLLLVNYRPGYTPPFAGAPGHSEIALRPLGPGDAQALLEELLGSDASLAGLPERVLERAGGNPFFLEEIARALAGSGILRGERGHYRLDAPVERIEIPASLQALLAARIDRLEEPAKLLLQSAAVVGERFDGALSARVSALPEAAWRRALAALVAAELLVEESSPPGGEYRFRHSLTREVAYRSQLEATRARRHAEVARAIEERDRDPHGARAALLAHHWESAGDVRRAALWHRRAAEATGFVDVPGALHHWGQLRRLAAQLPDDAETRELRLRACWSFLDNAVRGGRISPAEATALFAEGDALARRCGDTGARVRLHESLATRLAQAGDLEGQRRQLEQAARLAEGMPDTELRLLVLQRSFVALFHHGDFERALALAEEGIALAERDPSVGGSDPGHYRLGNLWLARANALEHLGRLDECEAALERFRALGDGPRSPSDWSRNVHTHALVRATLALARGDAPQSLRAALDFGALAERTGSPWAAIVSQFTLGRAELLAGRAQAAREAFERSLDAARQRGLALESEGEQLAALAEAEAGCGDAERARRSAEEAVAVSQRLGTRFREVYAHAALARALLTAASAGSGAARERIASELDRAELLVGETGGAVARPGLLLLRAELAERSGDAAGRQAALREARRLALEMGARGHAERIASHLGLEET